MPDEPANLRLLRRLVTTLMVVMILGLITIVGLFVMRLGSVSSTTPNFAEVVTLPEGEVAVAYTQGPTWYAVVTQSNLILIYKTDGTLLQRIEVTDGD
ncbi:MAG: DUF6476 family protein [Pseudomonadota bacterium]